MNISFANPCPVESWMPDTKKEFRNNCDHLISAMLAKHEGLFSGDVSVTYFTGGVASVVAKITDDKNASLVLKTALTPEKIHAEINAYVVLDKAGVHVPSIMAQGTAKGHAYYFMPLYTSGVLDYELDKEAQDTLADVFVQIQTITGTGYGDPVLLTSGTLGGKIPDLQTYLTQQFMEPILLTNVQTHEPSTEWKTLRDHYFDIALSNNESVSRLGSYDFKPAHFFSTEPFTFFDPSPQLKPKYFDLAKLMRIDMRLSSSQRAASTRQVQKIVRRHQEAFGPIDQTRVTAAYWLQTFQKAGNILRKPEPARVDRAKFMLANIYNDEALKAHIALFL